MTTNSFRLRRMATHVAPMRTSLTWTRSRGISRFLQVLCALPALFVDPKLGAAVAH